MNMIKMFLLLVMSMLAISMVSAVNLQVNYLKINGEVWDEVVTGNDHADFLEVQRGEKLEIKIRVKALSDVENVQIEADIYGYKYADREEELVSDVTKTFDMNENATAYKTLNLMIPVNMDKKYTKLRIRVGDEDGTSFEKTYELQIKGVESEEAVIVKDYSFTPSDSVVAGRAFTAAVKVENIGDEDLDDVKVVVSIPELHIQDTEYLDDLQADEKETLEEFLLRIPECAKPGVYDVEITVEFNDGYDSTTTNAAITVLEGDTCGVSVGSTERTVVSVPQTQDVEEGKEAVYPLMITNQGKSSKIYTVTVSGISAWGNVRIDPSAVLVVPAGETNTAYLYVTPMDANKGENAFKATISSEGESKDIVLTANVVTDAKDWGSLKGLEIALIVLVIILIIIGLVIGFGKLKGGSEDEEGTQTYY
ncbi:MAG: putative S-layer protein [Nanoarchaeota archaeon]|nr:putative S-layer protein [Nanoarchaeota archaeon]MBU1030710.1 putative S-layer protein [Nanoarchaeota archaeon]MBU1849555.1 putative S-layer protein [Nanoarchaeota archaeon]